MIDVVPTVLAAAGLPQPKTVNGVVQKPIEGVSMMNSFDDAQAKSARTTQYYEIYGNRGIYKDGWYASTLHKVSWEPKPRTTSYADDKWELCNLTEDYSCSTDVSAQHPDKLKELQAAFMDGGDQVQRAAARRSRPGAIQRHARRASRVHGRADVARALPGHDRDEGERLHRREEPELLDHRRARAAAVRASSSRRVARIRAGACTSRTGGPRLPTTSWAP